MSVQDEHELRRRLGALLNDVEPSPAPVARVVRQGRGIRVRRWISVAACLAVIAAGAVVIPGLLLGHTTVPSAPLHYKITLRQLGDRASRGVIGAGVTDGKQWKVRLSGRPGQPMLVPEGLPMLAVNSSPTPVGWPASLESEGGGGPGSGNSALIAGTVAASVTRLEMSLPDGEQVTITPVRWGGHRWVAVVIPWGIRIVRMVAYSGRTELAYAVPFGNVELTTWWRPGQVPHQARVTRLIGAGVTDGISWRAAADIGPWGYCYTFQNGSDCVGSTTSPQLVPAGALIAPMTCGPLTSNSAQTAPVAGLVAAAAGVSKVVLRYSDGSTATFPAVAVSGGKLVGYAIPGHVKVVRSAEYGSGGQVIGTTSGATWKC